MKRELKEGVYNCFPDITEPVTEIFPMKRELKGKQTVHLTKNGLSVTEIFPMKRELKVGPGDMLFQFVGVTEIFPMKRELKVRSEG